MQASPDHWPRRADAPGSSRGTPSRVARPTSDTQKGFSQLYSHHSFNTLTPPRIPIPHFQNGLSLNIDIKLKVSLEKEHRHLRRERKEPALSILIKAIPPGIIKMIPEN